MSEGRPLPKFGDWDVNDPASAEGFTMIFNKARNEKKTGGKPDSPTKPDSNTNTNHGMEHVKTPGVSGSLVRLKLYHDPSIICPLDSIPTGNQKNGFAACKAQARTTKV